MNLEKLIELFKKQLEEVEAKLSDSSIVGNPSKLMELSKRHAELKEISRSYDLLASKKQELQEWEEIKELLSPEEREEAEKNIAELQKEIEQIELNLKFLLIPDELGGKDIIVEIRAGTGGEEAALFAGDLFRMYTRYAERNSWKVETLESNETDLGGFKEVTFQIKGKDVFRKLKYESGVHRVQRIPQTESGGRIHTSTATVAVLPKASEVDVAIDPSELRIDTFRSSGAGGQHVNRTESAVRIVHLPTGITVTVQSERSQHQNKARAMEILRARLYSLYRSQQESTLSQQRRSQIGTGERSEKIRTYNFPQNRVTDHRINYTTYRLQDILDGDLDELIAKLAEADINIKLEKLLEEMTTA